MGEHPQDGQQASLRTAARAIVRFEHEHELPRLRQLVSEHAAAVSAIEVAKQKLTRLERSIRAHEEYVIQRFSTADIAADAIDLLAWRLSATLGAQAVERLTRKAVDVEAELKKLIKDCKGISDCLQIERDHGWDKVTRESFDWLRREVAQTEKEATWRSGRA